MTHPRSAFGDAPSGFALSPSRGRHQWTGKAGSTVALALAVVMFPAFGIDVGAERARIAAERKAIDERFVQEEKACRAKFAVTDCTAEAKARQREQLANLRRQEVALNDMERKRRAAEKLREDEERQAREREERAKDRKEAQAEQKDREARHADKTARKAKDDAERAAKPVSPRQPKLKTETITAAQAQANREKYAERLREAEEHRAKAARRQAERTKPPASSLPVSQ